MSIQIKLFVEHLTINPNFYPSIWKSQEILLVLLDRSFNNTYTKSPL